MKCFLALERERNSGHVKTKMVNHLKNPYRKEPDFDNIVDQLSTRLQDIKNQESSTSAVGMHLHSPEQTDAVQRYYAAFPALKKGEESPLQYYLPPPAWCRKSEKEKNIFKMQCDLSLSNNFNVKNKKLASGKERRNSYHGQRKSNKKRSHNHSRSFESKENLPEWVTHEGEWDMDTQDPIKEFIRAIALDEGYGTCENTVTDDFREITEMNTRMNEMKVPDWDDSLDLDSEWIIPEELKPHVKTPMEEELYAKFEAKFDRSIEALWSKDQANTPDDDYQDLPIDFQDLLSSPSDNQFFNPSAEKCSLISLTESIWSNDSTTRVASNHAETPLMSIEVLHDRFKPLNLTDNVYRAETKSPVHEIEPFSLYSYEGIYEAVPSVSDVMRSLTAINHSKSQSSFTEVIPRRRSERKPTGEVVAPEKVICHDTVVETESDREDLLTSTKTHFRPIRKEAETVEVSNVPVCYADGDTFDIRGELESVEYRRSESGFMYLESDWHSPKRYLEYRTRSIDYGRLNLTEAQREGNDLDNREFKLKFPLKQIEIGVQTDESENVEDIKRGWGACEECGRRGSAKKMRQSGIDSIWSDENYCEHCSVEPLAQTLPAAEELSQEWEELLSDISAAHAQYATEANETVIVEVSADRKRRHSAALRCRPHGDCSHPHAPFLHCVGADRPLTR